VKDKFGYWSTPYDYAFMMDAVGQILIRIAPHRMRSAPIATPCPTPAVRNWRSFHLARTCLVAIPEKPGMAREELKRFLSSVVHCGCQHTARDSRR